MRFPYQHYEIPRSPINGSTELFRPEIPLHLIGELDELYVFGLLDTGADGVVIGKGLADTLGVEIDENVRWPLRGFSDQIMQAFLGHLDIEIMDSLTSVTWRMSVGIVEFDDPRQEDIIILGQTGFLEFFDVRFLGGEHIIDLVPNSSIPRQTNPATS